MALLTSPDIVPEAMRFLVRGLLAVKDDQVERDELLELVAPQGLIEALKPSSSTPADMDEDDEVIEIDATPTPDGQGRSGGYVIAKQSLEALRTLGIVTVQKNRVALTDVVTTRWKRVSDVAPRAFRALVLDQVLTLGLLGSLPDEIGAKDLLSALEIYYTAPDPMSPIEHFELPKNAATNSRTFQQLQRDVLGSDDNTWPVRNKTRWPPLRRWAPYLGLARRVGPKGIVPDAGDALLARLGNHPAGTYDVREFVAQCSLVLPLLDGGTLQFRHDPERTGSTEVLSPALSLTLTQLEADGVIKMDKQSDTGVRIIRLRSDRSLDRQVTIVEWMPKAKDGGIA